VWTLGASSLWVSPRSWPRVAGWNRSHDRFRLDRARLIRQSYTTGDRQHR